MVASGALLFSLGMSELGSNRSAEAPTAAPTAAPLVSSGVFAFSRNPQFVGLVVLCIGVAVMQNCMYGLLVSNPLLLYIAFVAVPEEEKSLKACHGKEYATTAYYTGRSHYSVSAIWLPSAIWLLLQPFRLCGHAWTRVLTRCTH